MAGAPLPPGEVTRLLGAWGGGDRAAADRLFALLYEELRRIAHRALADQRHEDLAEDPAIGAGGVAWIERAIAAQDRAGTGDRFATMEKEGWEG